MVYTMYMSGIYLVYTIYSCLQDLKDEYAFLKFSGVYVALYTPMPWVSRRQCIRQKFLKKHIYPSNAVNMNVWYMYGISKTYTWYIPYIYQV